MQFSLWSNTSAVCLKTVFLLHKKAGRTSQNSQTNVDLTPGAMTLVYCRFLFLTPCCIQRVRSTLAYGPNLLRTMSRWHLEDSEAVWSVFLYRLHDFITFVLPFLRTGTSVRVFLSMQPLKPFILAV